MSKVLSEEDLKHMKPSLVRHELWQLLRLALPAIVTSCSTMAMTATDQIMVGHLGRDALAAASIGNTWYNLMFYFQLGFSSALDTQASQAFGAGDMRAVHACLVTALVLGTAAGLPMLAGLLATQPVAAVMFRQPPAVAAEAASFCTRLTPGVLPQLLGLQLIKFLQAQNQMAAPAALSVLAVLVNIGLNFLFVRHYGFLGAPLATTLSRVLFCVAAAGLVAHALLRAPRHRAATATAAVDAPPQAHCRRASKEEQQLLSADGGAVHAVLSDHSTQKLAVTGNSAGGHDSSMAQADDLSSAHVAEGVGVGPTTQLGLGLLSATEEEGKAEAGGVGSEGMRAEVVEAVRRGLGWQALSSFLRLAIPGGLMVAIETSSFDVTTAFAGMLGVVQVDAHVALLTIISFNFISFPFGIAVAATIRVGNLLGAGRPAAARACGWCAVALGAASMALCAVAIGALRGRLAALFIDDAAVARMLASVVLLGAAAEVFDGIMGTAQGVLRGAGKQVRILQYNLLGFWGVGVTTGAVLTFGLGWGLRGLWVGMLCGIFTTAALNFHAFYRLDWTAEAAAVRGAVAAAGDGIAAGDVHMGRLPSGGCRSEGESVLTVQGYAAACAADAAVVGDVHAIDEM